MVDMVAALRALILLLLLDHQPAGVDRLHSTVNCAVGCMRGVV